MQFKLKTALVLTACAAATAGIVRGDLVSVIGGISVLFAVFVFAEDIWTHLAK